VTSIRLAPVTVTSLPILEGCLNVTCVQCENGKPISPIDSAQPTMAHGARTDSDLARGASPAMLWRTRVLVTRSEATMERWLEAARTTRSSTRSGPAEDRAQPAEGRGRRTGGGSGPTTSIRSTGGALTNRMTAETLRVRADIACVPVFYANICTVTTARKWG
jgi:hypothetical protein